MTAGFCAILKLLKIVIYQGKAGCFALKPANVLSSLTSSGHRNPSSINNNFTTIKGRSVGGYLAVSQKGLFLVSNVLKK
jgi:hypothetical protein